MAHKLLFASENYPVLQNRTYETYEEAVKCATGQISLVQDLSTGLIFNEAFDENLIKYDVHYHNEQTFSPMFRRHMEKVADLLISVMAHANFVEVGCGKGDFLELMQGRGQSITGFDPAYEGSNPNIERKLFTGQLEAQDNVLILRHVLEHIKDPINFLKHLRDANGGGGMVYIEVPCFDWILENDAYFDIFYEHVNYFRLPDFYRIFDRIVYAGKAFGGQYLSIIADLSSIQEMQMISGTLDLPENFFPTNFDNGSNQIIWGAASKGVIYSMLRERRNSPILRVIDLNPAKQGRYLPITGHKVLSPAAGLANLLDGSKILVMNPNYLAEIQDMVGNIVDCEAV